MLLQIFDPGRDIHDPHEAAQDRLLRAPGHADNRFGGGQRVGHRLRRQDHQGPVYPFILDNRRQRIFITIRGGIPDDIDRIVEIGGLGQMAGQGRDGFFLKRASLRPDETVTSVATIPGPPALVTMATRLPWGPFGAVCRGRSPLCRQRRSQNRKARRWIRRG